MTRKKNCFFTVCTTLSLHKSQVAHEAGDYPDFRIMERLEGISTSPSTWIGCLVNPNIRFAGTHLYIWTGRSTAKIKCFAQ